MTPPSGTKSPISTPRNSGEPSGRRASCSTPIRAMGMPRCCSRGCCIGSCATTTPGPGSVGPRRSASGSRRGQLRQPAKRASPRRCHGLGLQFPSSVKETAARHHQPWLDDNELQRSAVDNGDHSIGVVVSSTKGMPLACLPNGHRRGVAVAEDGEHASILTLTPLELRNQCRPAGSETTVGSPSTRSVCPVR